MAAISKEFGFIGAGNMGEAIIGALLKANLVLASRVHAYDIMTDRLQELKEKYKISVERSNVNLFETCEVVVLAIKPQQMEEVLAQLSDRPDYKIKNRKLIISIAAGVRLEKIEQFLYSGLNESEKKMLPIIRVMPNTPALVRAGMSVMSPNAFCEEADTELTRSMLLAMGRTLTMEEKYLDAVTAVSGSGPAYVFYFIEAMIKGGMETGLDEEDSRTLTMATVEGALKLLEDSGETPEDLRKKVTSKGGTTEAALKVFEDNKMMQTISTGIVNAARRAKELSE
jgi:pyrroline-5-carboxylate reductase